jgi:hypothetical protein
VSGNCVGVITVRYSLATVIPRKRGWHVNRLLTMAGETGGIFNRDCHIPRSTALSTGYFQLEEVFDC